MHAWRVSCGLLWYSLGECMHGEWVVVYYDIAWVNACMESEWWYIRAQPGWMHAWRVSGGLLWHSLCECMHGEWVVVYYDIACVSACMESEWWCIRTQHMWKHAWRVKDCGIWDTAWVNGCMESAWSIRTQPEWMHAWRVSSGVLGHSLNEYVHGEWHFTPLSIPILVQNVKLCFRSPLYKLKLYFSF